MVNIDTSRHLNLKHLEIFTILFFIIESIYLIVFNNTWFDETNYLYESWLYIDQNLIPYIDFYSKVPVIPFIIYGIPQSLFGTSIYIGRIESTIFTGLMLLLVYKIATKLADEKAGVFAVLLILFNFYSMQYFTSTTLHSLSNVFLLLSLYLIISDMSNPLKSITSIFFVDMAILTRPNMGFAAVILLFYILMKKDNGIKTKVTSLATFILVPLTVLAPFLFMNFKKTIFQIPFSPLQDILGLEYPVFVDSFFGDIRFLLKLTFPFDYIHETFFMTLIISSFIVYLLYSKKTHFFKENEYFTLIFSMAVSLVFITYVFSPHPCQPYIIYAVPMMAILAAIIIFTITNNVRSKDFTKIVYSICAVGLILTTFSLAPIDAAPMKDTSIMKTERGADAIIRHTTPDDKILSLLYTNGEVLLAERVIYPHTIHYPWNYQPTSSSEDCYEYFQVNNGMIKDWISKDADVVLISDLTFSYISREPYLEYKIELVSIINKELDENYTLVETVEDSLNPNMKIYVRNEHIDEK